jgi:hypothetical protein
VDEEARQAKQPNNKPQQRKNLVRIQFLYIQYYVKTLTKKYSQINKLVYFKEKNNTEKDLKLNEF